MWGHNKEVATPAQDSSYSLAALILDFTAFKAVGKDAYTFRNCPPVVLGYSNLSYGCVSKQFPALEAAASNCTRKWTLSMGVGGRTMGYL